MSRLQTGAVAPVLTTAPVLDVVTAALAELGDRGRVRVVPPLPEVTADLGLLARVIVNLVGNALRHTDGPVEVRGRADGSRAYVMIVDHGPGVPAEDRDRLFEPFRRLGDQRSSDGIGLGLAVARGLVEAQGGSLRAEETQAAGSPWSWNSRAPR